MTSIPFLANKVRFEGPVNPKGPETEIQWTLVFEAIDRDVPLCSLEL